MVIDQEALKKELIEAFHLENIPEAKQEELLSKIGEALLKRIFLETMEKIGDANVKEYEALLDKAAKEEEVQAFFESKIPGYNIFVRGVVTRFKEEMAEGLAA
ncbi:MAG: DUF5663 domain-containing protein [bacterium]|nr:DUF5663 domain-containing protein [bacterium]